MKHKYILLCSLFLGLLGINAHAQENSFAAKRKGSLIGFGVNLTDYTAALPEIGKLDMGASLLYWQGLANHLDLSVRYNGTFSDYAKPREKDRGTNLINELEGSFHLRALHDAHLFNPFISAGIGVGYYSKSFVPYAPVGIGLQVNLYSQTYFFLQGNYRFSFKEASLDHNTFYSLGVMAPISTPVDKAPKELPPPVDTDGDGIADGGDACPDVPGLAKFDGCPDTDKDGVPDKIDKCPSVAGVLAYGGCPVPDKDKDGINDDEDQCIDIPGTAKYKGCPVPDSDHDGINDEEDRCPSEAGPAANGGCPEVKEEVKKRLAFAATAIQFETGKAIIRKPSYKLLDEIVGILNEYPDYNMTIDGHTDNVGKPARNLELSAQRAEAVKAYFVAHGINEGRLSTQGYGDTKPQVSNNTAKGRARNRRVEMDLKLK